MYIICSLTSLSKCFYTESIVMEVAQERVKVNHNIISNKVIEPRSHVGDRGSITGRDKPKSLNQVVTAPLPNAEQQVRVSRIQGDDRYKRKFPVKESVARSRTLTAQWPWMPSMGQNVKPFIGNGDVSLCVRKCRVGRKKKTKQFLRQSSAWVWTVWVDQLNVISNLDCNSVP